VDAGIGADQYALRSRPLGPVTGDGVAMIEGAVVNSSLIYQPIVVESLNSLDGVERIQIFQTGSEKSRQRGRMCVAQLSTCFSQLALAVRC
jgi:hypothetical protein